MEVPILRQVLQLVNDGSIYWTIREGGNQSYQVHRHVVKHLLKEHMIEKIKVSCCKASFKITPLGEEYLNGK